MERPSAHAFRRLFLVCGDRLSDDERRQIYPELLKRMDDSRNEIRIATCGVVAAFFETCAPDYDETNTGYFLKARRHPSSSLHRFPYDSVRVVNFIP